MTTGYLCAACGTEVADFSQTTCLNCGVDFGKVSPVVGHHPSATLAAGPRRQGWQIPPEYDPSWGQRPWLRRHWRLVIGLTVVGAVVAIYAALFAILGMMMSVPTQRINTEITEASGGQILTVLYVPGVISGGGSGRFTLTLAPDVTAADAQALACTVVKPTLAREGYQAAGYELRGVFGAVLANDATPCP